MGHLVVVCFAQEWSPPALHTAQALEKLRSDGEPTSPPPCSPIMLTFPFSTWSAPSTFQLHLGKEKLTRPPPGRFPAPLRVRTPERGWLLPGCDGIRFRPAHRSGIHCGRRQGIWMHLGARGSGDTCNRILQRRGPDDGEKTRPI